MAGRGGAGFGAARPSISRRIYKTEARDETVGSPAGDTGGQTLPSPSPNPRPSHHLAWDPSRTQFTPPERLSERLVSVTYSSLQQLTAAYNRTCSLLKQLILPTWILSVAVQKCSIINYDHICYTGHLAIFVIVLFLCTAY